MNQTPLLRLSNIVEEFPLQASKWLSVQILVDGQEMESLFDALGEFYIYTTGSVMPRGKEGVTRSEFLQCYKDYVQALQEGRLLDDSCYRRAFTSVFTVAPDTLYAMIVEGDKQLVRVARPVIQLQAHRMDYSRADGKFRSMTFGGDSVTWGIQFSYPQIYQDGKTKEIHDVDSSDACPNTPLFRALQLWVRNNTAPTAFLVDGKKINIPVRLGKQCTWINCHPQLAPKGLHVEIKESL